MRAAVTGASGFIGGHLVKRLSQDGWEVRVLVHRNRPSSREELRIFQGDILDPDSLAGAFEGADVLFHLAARLGAPSLGEEAFLAANREGTENVLTAARAAGVKRVIHFSSGGVLGSVEGGRAADEHHPPRPLDPYDLSKWEGEKVALHHASGGSDVVIVRPGWVYGPGDRRTYKLIRAVARRRFMLVAGGSTLQTPVYIDDLIQGTLLCARKGRSGEIYHLAGGEVLSAGEIVDAIAGAAGTRVPRLPIPLPLVKATAWAMERAFALFHTEAPLTRGRLAFFIHPKPLAIQKAVKELEYRPRTTFAEGIQRTVAWYRANGWLD